MNTPYKAQLVYALFLTVAIPTLLIGTVIWNLQDFTKITDTGLQQQAILLTDAFTPTALRELSNPAALVSSMKVLVSRQPHIREITTYKFVDSAFVVVASTDPNKQLQVLNKTNSNKAWTEGKPVASVQIVQPSGERVWSVVSPIFDSSGTKSVLLETKISTEEIDTTIHTTYYHSGLLVCFEVLLILLLLINYFKFATYARLYHGIQEINETRQGLINMISLGIELPAITLQNYTSLLYKTYKNSLDIRANEYLEAMVKHSTKLVAVVLSLSEYSKVQQGKTPLTAYPLSFDELCDVVCEEILRIPTDSAPVLLNYERPSTSVIIVADLEILKQIIFNILSLILRYSNYGNVTMRFDQSQSGISRLIIDPANLTMDSEVQANFFKPHLQLQDATTDQFADLGVIYLLSSQLIQKMGGKMGVNFNDNGKATFWIQFPLSTQKVLHESEKNF